MNFYGFNWQDVPAYSRLFSPTVVNRAQSAYGQGMGQFTPYDPQQLEKIKAAQEAQKAQQAQASQAKSSGKFAVGPDGRLYDTTAKNWFGGYVKNNPTLNDFRANELAAREANQFQMAQKHKPSQEINDQIMKFYGFKTL